MSASLREQVSARVFESTVDLRKVDVDGLVAAVSARCGPGEDVASIDEETWSRLLEDHDPDVQDRRAARASSMDHRTEP